MASDQKETDDEMRQEARTETMINEPAPEAESHLPAEAQGLIGHQLRQEYRRILAEPLPDKFTKLLEQLAQSESEGKAETEK
jgi:hypothetical protein